jgi:hypothetical protein
MAMQGDVVDWLRELRLSLAQEIARAERARRTALDLQEAIEERRTRGACLPGSSKHATSRPSMPGRANLMP